MKIEPFCKLPLQELERLSILVQVARHAKGDVLYNEGDEAADFWLLQSGRIQIFKYSSEGRPMAIESIEPKQLFGTLERLGVVNFSTYPCTAVACIDSVSIKICNRIFQSLLAHNPDMVASICRLCSQRLNWMQERALFHQTPMRQRVVKVLFELRETNGDVLNVTKREISELAGTTVESTIRVLSEFRKNRWIASERGKLTLTNLPGMQQILAGQEKMASQFPCAQSE